MKEEDIRERDEMEEDILIDMEEDIMIEGRKRRGH